MRDEAFGELRGALQAWEQGAREPSNAALKLLSIAGKHPEVLLES